MEVKLLTEAEWREVLAHTENDDDVIEALRERGLIAPEPLDAEVDAIFVPPRSDKDMKAMILAALRRGMDLQREAQPALTRERVEAAHKGTVWRFTPLQVTFSSDAFIDRLHTALTQPPHADKGVGHE